MKIWTKFKGSLINQAEIMMPAKIIVVNHGFIPFKDFVLGIYHSQLCLIYKPNSNFHIPLISLLGLKELLDKYEAWKE